MTHDDQQTLRIDPLTDSVDGVARAVERLGARGIGERLARAAARPTRRATWRDKELRGLVKQAGKLR